jgi:hypothetical protein
MTFPGARIGTNVLWGKIWKGEREKWGNVKVKGRKRKEKAKIKVKSK